MPRELSAALSALVAGDRAAADLLRFDPDAVRVEAERGGVLPLAAEALRAAGGADSAVCHLLVRAATEAAAVDLWREVELRRAAEAFAADRLPVLFLKGAQLAYDTYARPDLRPRTDTDVLVRPTSPAAADAILSALGYERQEQVSGAFVTHQAIYVKRDAAGVRHAVDLHWRIANPEVFSTVLSFDELWATRVALPALSPRAYGLAWHHALLLACVHRVAHHFDDDRLIWLYDIHLLVGRAGAHDWPPFVSLAVLRGVAAVTLRSLERTSERLGTCIPADVLADLRAAAQREDGAASRVYLSPTHRPVETFLSDLRALRSWRHRVSLVREHLFPPRQYMRRVYAPASHAPLPLLYVVRALAGARKWLGKSN